MKRKPTSAQWERFQTQSREEQIEIIKRHLSRVFNRRFAASTNESFEHGRDHAESCFIANRMNKYIRQEDNSVRGFHRRYQNFSSPGHREEFIQSRLAQMCEIPTPLPPQFVALANYDGKRRFLEINYQGTKPMIGDGTMSNTFPYYDAYSPLIDHAAIFAHLWQERAFLGADDGEATHSLVLDTEKNKIYIATRRQAYQFLEIQLPQTPEERRAEDDRLQKLFADFHAPKSLGDLQNMGLFQLIAPVNDRSKEVAAMTGFLDEYVPENVQQAMMECLPA